MEDINNSFFKDSDSEILLIFIMLLNMPNQELQDFLKFLEKHTGRPKTEITKRIIDKFGKISSEETGGD